MTDSELTTAITNIADGTPNTAAEFRAILTELVNRSYKTGDILMISCSNQYIIDNFDGTGLGIVERTGWARCNGQNGTRDYETGNRIPMPFGGSYTTMGAPLGSQDSVVVEHTHKFISNTTPVSNIFDTVNKFLAKLRPSGGDNQYELQSTNIAPTVGDTTTEGVSGINKNIQNSRITLFIQKINV